MSRLSRKFLAVLMMLWLPLSGGSALASSLAMEIDSGHDMTMSHTSCHEMADMDAMDMPEDMIHGAAHGSAGDSTPVSSGGESGVSCHACGVCHLACSGYMVVPGVLTLHPLQASFESTPYRFFFASVTSTPLVPPPLVSA